MSKRLFLYIFIIIVIADFLACEFFPDLRFFTKPLVMIALFIYYFFELRGNWISVDTLFLLALIAAWFGDVFLLWGEFFVWGLLSFLAMQILYTIVFVKGKNFFGKREALYGVLVFIFMGLIIGYLWPSLDDMKLPIVIYGLTISMMSLVAYTRDMTQSGYLKVWIGTMLFLVSDMTLAIDKFSTIQLHCYAAMCTYVIAQYLIVDGYIDYRKQGQE